MFPWSVCPTPLLVNLEWSPSCWTQGKDQEATWDNNGWVTWHNITTRLWTDEEDPVGNENHAVRERTRFSKLCTFILHAAKSCMLSSNSISSPPPHKARLFSKVQLSVVFYMFVALIFIWLFSIPICNSALLQILPNSTGAVYVVAWFLHATVVSSFPGPCSFQLHVNCGGYIGGGTLLLSAKNFSSQKSCAESGEASNCKLMYIFNSGSDQWQCGLWVSSRLASYLSVDWKWNCKFSSCKIHFHMQVACAEKAINSQCVNVVFTWVITFCV